MILHVKEHVQKVALAFSPSSNEMKDLAEILARQFDTNMYETRVMPAEKIHIPDITASSLLVFGSNETGKAFQEGGFKELSRAFTGISLAGRSVLLFSYDSPDAVKELEAVIKDTELKVVGEPLVYMRNGKPVKDQKVSKLIKELTTL